MMLVKMLEWVKAHSGAETITVGNREYVRFGYEVQKPPLALPVEFGTLTGFAEFVRLTMAKELSSGFFVHVVGPRLVYLRGALDPIHRTREETGRAVPTVAIDDVFRFNHPLTQDAFVTQAQALFVDDEETDKARLLRVVGNLRTSDVQTLEDDGISQQVATARGVTMKEMAVMPNPVRLREFITFPEVCQPLGEYIVRVKCGADHEYTTISLMKMPDPGYDADCSAEIVAWLRNELPDTPVLG